MLDELGHHCGVGAISPTKLDSKESFVPLAIEIAKNLEHRGQCGYGFAGVDETIWTERETEPIRSSKVVDGIAAHRYATSVTFHTRYSTTPVEGMDGVHPIEIADEDPNSHLAFSFNGNIPDCAKARAEIQRMGFTGELKGDTDVIARFLYTKYKHFGNWDAAIGALPKFFDGAYNGVFLLRNGDSFAFRDPLGMHPLVMTEMNGMAIVASEDAAIRKAVNHSKGPYSIREIQPGHFVHLSPGKKPRIEQFADSAEVPSCLQVRANCLFEDIYFADWESHIEGDPISHARFEWGKVHAELDGDSMKDAIVVPVPYSANVSGLGYSRQSGCSYVEAIKKKKKGRTFIENQAERKKRAETSYELNDFLKEGQKLVIVDDSVVRGGTMQGLISRVRAHFKPSEIHLRLASPAIIAPCYYGIDMRTPDELIARKHFAQDELRSSELPMESLHAIAKELGVDSIRYLPLDKVTNGITRTRENLCMGCFTGKYPTQDGQRLYQLGMKQWREESKK